MATFREAVIRHLRENTGSGSLVEKLGNDATRITPRRTLKAEDTFPAIVVQMAHEVGSAERRPHADQVLHVFVYTRNEARNVPDWITLDELVDLVVTRLNGVEPGDMTTTIDGDFKPWEITFDGVSRDLFNTTLRADYRWVRFRTPGVRTSTQS